METHYNIGDRVIINTLRHGTGKCNKVNCRHVNEFMITYDGRLATIKGVNSDYISLSIDGIDIAKNINVWHWSTCMITLVTKNKEKKPTISDCTKDSINTIKYNRHIKAIGIEFEGLYKPVFVDYIRNNYMQYHIADIGHDASIHHDDVSISSGMHSLEMRSRPLDAKQANEILSVFNTAQKKEEYYINNSIGLHYHISLDNIAYSAVDTPEFYSKYMRMFKKNYPIIYENRKQSRYCTPFPSKTYKSAELAKKRHFTRSSSNRYHFINYCYSKHGTVEFRGFGGFGATFTGLANIIQDTINLIGEHTRKKYSIQSKEVISIDNTKRIDNIVIPNRRRIYHHRNITDSNARYDYRALPEDWQSNNIKQVFKIEKTSIYNIHIGREYMPKITTITDDIPF